jgi:hypothetical protein
MADTKPERWPAVRVLLQKRKSGEQEREREQAAKTLAALQSVSLFSEACFCLLVVSSQVSHKLPKVLVQETRGFGGDAAAAGRPD